MHERDDVTVACLTRTIKYTNQNGGDFLALACSCFRAFRERLGLEKSNFFIRKTVVTGSNWASGECRAELCLVLC